MTNQNPDTGSPEPKSLNLEDIVEQYQASLLRYATRTANNEEIAQDAVQLTFIRLYKNWNKLKKRGVPIKPWLFRTAHNATVDEIRKESRRRLLHEKQSVESAHCSSQRNTDRENSERFTLVITHLNALKPKEREALVLRLQENMSYKQIADVLGRSEGYVGTLIHSATRKLTKRLKQAGVVS